MERSIIHLNVADFAVAVESLIDPGLRGYPLAIAPGDSSRACIYDMSEEAFQQGIQKSMPLARARRICRDLRILPPRFDRYERAMKDIVKEALPYSPLIEYGEADGHIFMDLTGSDRLFGPPRDVAWKLARKIKRNFALEPIWSVASSKLVAKIATRLVKPVGEYIVRQGEEQELLKPLPLGLVPGMEKSDLVKLKEFNFNFVYEVLAMDMEHLRVFFGKRAGFIYDLMRGVDFSPVLPVFAMETPVEAEYEFAGDTNDRKTLKSVMYILTEKICMVLRRKGRAAEKLKLKIGYTDGVHGFGILGVKPASSNELKLYKAAEKLLDRVVKRRIQVRYIRLVCDKYIFSRDLLVQMDLFENTGERAEKQEALIKVMDKIRDRFGYDAIGAGIGKLAL